MKIEFHGDKINIFTQVEQTKDGYIVKVSLTDELTKFLQEIREKIDNLEKLIWLDETYKRALYRSKQKLLDERLDAN